MLCLLKRRRLPKTPLPIGRTDRLFLRRYFMSGEVCRSDLVGPFAQTDQCTSRPQGFLCGRACYFHTRFILAILYRMKKHQGGCHCKRIRYEVSLDLVQPVLECNCSHCQMKGMLLSFVDADQFSLLSGEDACTDYRFNTEKIAHLFCATCGVQCFGRGNKKDGTPTVALNVRTIDDVDLATLTRTPVDGKSF